MTLSVKGVGHDDDKRIKRPEIKFTEFNNLYTQLKSGKPIIGNMLNGTTTPPSETGQAAAQF